MKEILATYSKDWRAWTVLAGVASAAAFLAYGKTQAAAFLASVLVILAAVLGAFKWISGRVRARRAKDLEKAMLSQSSPPLAEGRASIQELTKGFQRALERLRNAPELGMDYLYRVPWYLIIGEPASGKTTTVRYSNLELLGDKQQGIAGTLNCDWWFTNHGIILDTAGRYVYAEEGAPDRKEWEAFLGLLKRYRSRQPLNGVILTIPVVRTKGSIDMPLLLPGVDGDAERELQERASRDAEKLYEKISRLPERLGIRFPVYILVTKCDKIPGFQEFFTQAPMEYQTQLLGWSNPDVEALYEPGMIDRAFESIEKSLERTRLDILAREMPLAFADEVFVFPEEFRRLRESLRHYTDILFKKNIFQESLIFRGVYFTSGLQDRKPLSGLLGQTLDVQAPGEVLLPGAKPGDSSKILGAGEVSLLESKPYFIRDFYSEKVFPESGLVRPTRARYERAKKLTSILRAATLAIGILGIVGFSFYLAMVLSASRELKLSVKGLRGDVFDSSLTGNWETGDKTIIVNKYASYPLEALNKANDLDYPVLDWIGLNLPTAEIKRDSFAVLDILVLQRLANIFLQKFHSGITAFLKEEVQPAPDLSKSKLIAQLKSLASIANAYSNDVLKSKDNNPKRVESLWSLAVGGDLPKNLKQITQDFGASRDLERHLNELPGLENILPPIQKLVMEKIGELDRVSDLKIETEIAALSTMADQMRSLVQEKAPFESRFKALVGLIRNLENLPKDTKEKAKTIEERFEYEFNERVLNLKKINEDLSPLTKAQLGPAVSGIGDKLGKAADGMIDSVLGKKDSPSTEVGPPPWKSSPRWEKLRKILEGGKLKVAGIGPQGSEIPLLGVKILAPAAPDGPAETRDLFCQSEAAGAFFKEIGALKGRWKVLTDENAVSEIQKDASARKEVLEKIEKAEQEITWGGFAATDHHLSLIREVRPLIPESKAPAAAAPPPAETPKPATGIPALREVEKGLVEWQVRKALLKFFNDRQEGQKLAFGEDGEKEFLAKLPFNDWLDGKSKERQFIEALQVHHALNLLRDQRNALREDPKIFHIDEEAVKDWDFATQARENNVMKLFRVSAAQAALDTYFEEQLKDLKNRFTKKISSSGSLVLLKDLKAEDRGDAYGFWEKTLAQLDPNDTNNYQAQKDIKNIIGRVVDLNSGERYKSMTKFIDQESADKRDRDQSFMELRYVTIRDVVISRIRRYLAETFKEGFANVSGKIDSAISGKFPIDPTAKELYTPMENTDLNEVENFFKAWELSGGGGPPPADKSAPADKKLCEYFRDQFQTNSGVDLVEGQRDLLNFVKENFFGTRYDVQLKVLNDDPAFKNFIRDIKEKRILEKSLLYISQGNETFEIQSGESKKFNPTVEFAWVNSQPIAFAFRLVTGESQLKIKSRQTDAPSGTKASYEFKGMEKEKDTPAWALFRMIFLHNQMLKYEDGNVLKFEFIFSEPIDLPEDKDLKRLEYIPIYVLLKIKHGGGQDKDFRRFDLDLLSKLYANYRKPPLQLR